MADNHRSRRLTKEFLRTGVNAAFATVFLKFEHYSGRHLPP